ncbi:iron-sulfur cluster biosynthesis family protein [uncultured Secundilactobacillus sp.]|uniref:iron-sulfur cluster biosynthesis family protein n=1 Tax=uncultured Secundilactobacillus sp. TaxID=2813935 RepID=UPI0025898D8B|nr:iron-sulfur cluster biosynthesis family protein [uncultured Secundilactobacillus sp.]
MIRLEMDDKVQARLKAHMTAPDDQLILDLDDGVGNYSSVGNCSLDTSFQLLIVTKDNLDPTYNAEVASPLGPVFIKDYTTTYIEGSPKLDLNKYGTIRLKTQAGTVDESVAIKDYPEVVAAAGKTHDC